MKHGCVHLLRSTTEDTRVNFAQQTEWLKYGSIISFRNTIEILSIGILNMEKHKHQLGEIRTNAKISNILYKCGEGRHNGAGDTSIYHHDSYPGSNPGILQKWYRISVKWSTGL